MNVSPREIERWALLWTPDDTPIVVLVIDDDEDDEIASVIAREDKCPSEHFGGLWGTGQRDGYLLAAFKLIHRELLEAILDVAHLVAVMPREIAGDANSGEAFVPRLGGALLVEVERRSPQIAQALAARDD